MKHPLDDVLLAALEPQTLYAVGGRVRDELRAEGGERVSRSADLDYVVTGTPLEELTRRLRRVGRVDVVGASFAVIKLSTPVGDADIALPRRERSTGVGHRDFAVEMGPEVPLRDDLARRDFRVNMMARAIETGELIDPYGGASDIGARRIDILRPEAFQEDPLRMLRACQFAARFNYAISAPAAEAMRAAAPMAASVAPERVAEELWKLMRAERPSYGIEWMRETGVLEWVWPELLEGFRVAQNEWHAYDVYRHNLETLDATPPGDPVLRLAALLHDIGKPRTKDGPHFYRHEHAGEGMVHGMLARLRLARDVEDTVAHLVRQHMYSADPEASPATIRRFIRRVGAEHLERLFALRSADVVGSGLPKRGDGNERFEARVRAIIAERPPFSVRDLAIGGDVVTQTLVARGLAARGFRGDERVGKILRYLFEQVTDDPARNDPAQLSVLVDRYIDEHYASARSMDAENHRSNSSPAG